MYRNRTFEHNYDDYEFSESNCISKDELVVVYKGNRTKDRKRFIIKRIMDEGFGQNEVENMKDLTRFFNLENYFVRLEGYFYHRNHIHLVMPYYEFGCLRDFIQSNRRISEGTIVTILEKLVNVLDFLHSSGFVHCNLTLRNIVVKSVVGDEVDVLISDLGLTKHTKGKQLKSTIGTLSYMHPRIGNGKDYGKEIDVYALGVILYSFFTRNDPKNGRDEMLNEARKFASSDAVNLLGKMLDIRRPIRLTEILLHQFMKTNQVAKSKKPCVHRTVDDGKCVTCSKIVRKNEILSKHVQFEEETLVEIDENVESWPLQKYEHLAPFVMPCMDGKYGRIILKGKKLIFEHVEGQYVDYVFKIQQSIRTSGLIHQTMSVFKPTSHKCVIPTDEKQKKPVQYSDRAIDTFTSSRMPRTMAQCYRLIQRSLIALTGRVARVDFLNIFGVRQLNAKLMYNGDFRLIFPNGKIFKRSPGKKEIVDILKLGRMNAEEADIFLKAEIVLQKYDEVSVFIYGEDHPPQNLSRSILHDDVNERVVAETSHIQIKQ